jgi:DNA-binding SARP family transcriptional activator
MIRRACFRDIMISFNVLGPVRLIVGDKEHDLPPKVTSLMALLLLGSNRPWRSEVLLDRLWRGTPPRTAESALRSYLAELRNATRTGPSPSRLVTTGHGYALVVEPDEYDVLRFERAHSAVATRPTIRAVDELRSSLLAWRVPAFEGQDDLDGFIARRATLEEQRGDAAAALASLDLASGQTEALLRSLPAEVVRHPTHERLAVAHIEALARSGDQVAALRSHRGYRDHIVTSFGLDPSSEFAALEGRLLDRDDPIFVPERRQPVALPTGTSTALVGRHEIVDDVTGLVEGRRTRAIHTT